MNKQKEELIRLTFEYTGEKPDSPFKKNPEIEILRHSASRKWFAVFMDVEGEKLGLKVNQKVDILNLKCDPLLSASLFSSGSIFPAYHMNKEKWISVLLNQSLPTEQILGLIEISYNLTK